MCLLQNCDELFAGAQRQISSRNSRTRETAKVRLFSAEKQQTGVCVNNFLRNHKRTDDDEWMEERRTTNKGFGVFAKKYIPAVYIHIFSLINNPYAENFVFRTLLLVENVIRMLEKCKNYFTSSPYHLPSDPLL